jgi:hypothetical protein
MANYLNWFSKTSYGIFIFFKNSQNHCQNNFLMKSIICQQECQALDVSRNPFLVETKG